MDYYLWENDKNEGDAFIYSGWPHHIPFSFFTGDRVAGVVPPIEITMNEQSQGRLTDNVLLTGSGRVFSKKLLDVLQEAGVDNIDTYPCIIRNLVTGEVHDTYSVVNVVGKISCIDRAKSDLVFATGSTTELLGYHSIVLDESKVGGARLFALAELPVQLVAHVDVVGAIEEADVTGIEFVPQDVED